MAEIKITPKVLSEKHMADLVANGFPKDQLHVFGMQAAAVDAKFSQAAVDAIVKDIAGKKDITLNFAKWSDGNILALDGKGRQCLVIGSWNEHRWFVRGIVRRKLAAKKFMYGVNGQVGQGGIQLGYYAEEYTVEFPQIKAASDAFNKLLKDRDQQIMAERKVRLEKVEGHIQFGQVLKVDRSYPTPLICDINGHCIMRAIGCGAGEEKAGLSDKEIIESFVAHPGFLKQE